MKLITILKEATTKKHLKEFNDQNRIIGDIFDWNIRGIGNFAYFSIKKHWREMLMGKRPDNLSEEELAQAIEECDKNIKFAQDLLDLSQKTKRQVENLADSASQISAGEKEYAGRQITPQHILDFLESILVTDEDNKQEMYELYNRYIKREYPNEVELPLESPEDLVVRGRIKGRDEVIFEYKRQSGKILSESAMYNSILKFVRNNYPEVAEYLLIRSGSAFKKYFTLRVRRSSMTSRPALNRSWRRIFIKYADWLAD